MSPAQRILALGGAACVLALLAWAVWANPHLPDVENPGSLEPSAVPTPAATAASADTPTEGAGQSRRSSETPVVEPTGVRVLCIWRSDRAPAAAIPVRAYRVRGGDLAEPVGLAVTDFAGTVTFSPLVPGGYAFLCDSAETRAEVIEGRLVPAVLTLPRFTGVRGTVVDVSDAVVAAADVGAEIDGHPVHVARTDPAGRFDVRLPARVAMWASKEAHLPSELVTPKGDA
ncbi:MAG: hypothetical protein ABL997_18310, partial [Planctomycetota bacterium]